MPQSFVVALTTSGDEVIRRAGLNACRALTQDGVWARGHAMLIVLCSLFDPLTDHINLILGQEWPTSWHPVSCFSANPFVGTF